jgi:hypothetical protein
MHEGELVRGKRPSGPVKAILWRNSERYRLEVCNADYAPTYPEASASRKLGRTFQATYCVSARVILDGGFGA